MKKSKDPQVWLLRNRGKAASDATLATLKAEGSGSLVHGGGGQSLGPGGRRLKTVDSGMDNLFGDDDEDGDQKRRTREMGKEGDFDEIDFEEDFADDEEKMDMDDKIDEDAKDLEVNNPPNYHIKISNSFRRIV